MFHAVERRSNFDGIDFGKLMGEWMADEAKPRTKAQVIDLLRKEGDTWTKFPERAFRRLSWTERANAPRLNAADEEPV